MAQTVAEAPAAQPAPAHPNHLRALRIGAGLSTREVADRLGISTKTINAWEVGRNSISADRLVQLADILDCTPNDILGYTKKGHLKGKVRVVSESEEELLDLYLDSDFNIQRSVRNLLFSTAKHPHRDQHRR